MSDATKERWIGDGGPPIDNDLADSDRRIRDLVVDAIVDASEKARKVEEARELRRRAAGEVARLDQSIMELEIAASTARGHQEGLWSVVLADSDQTVQDAFNADILGIKTELEARRSSDRS